MAFDWRDFLLFAHELRNETQESKQRTAIGRAYYYVYNVALTEAKKLGFNPQAKTKSPGGSHKKLWSWCQQQSNKDIVKLGLSGTTLHSRRIDVDYRNPPTLSMQQAVQRQLTEARDFELLLAQINKTQPPPPLP